MQMVKSEPLGTKIILTFFVGYSCITFKSPHFFKRSPLCWVVEIYAYVGLVGLSVEDAENGWFKQVSSWAYFNKDEDTDVGDNKINLFS